MCVRVCVWQRERLSGGLMEACSHQSSSQGSELRIICNQWPQVIPCLFNQIRDSELMALLHSQSSWTCWNICCYMKSLVQNTAVFFFSMAESSKSSLNPACILWYTLSKVGLLYVDTTSGYTNLNDWNLYLTTAKYLSLLGKTHNAE